MTAFARVTSHLLLRIHYILSLHPAFFADGAIDSGETLLTVASCLSTTIIAPTRLRCRPSMSKARRTQSGLRGAASLELAEVPYHAISSYPRTRSQTKAALPLPKRKISDSSPASPARPTKIARKHPLHHGEAQSRLSPEALVEGLSTDELKLCESERTMWPVNVPRSMLFTFRVGSSSPRSAATTCSDPADARTDCSVFSASGPQAMFDHTWRVTFVEPRTALTFGLPARPSPTTSSIAASPTIPHCIPTATFPADRLPPAPSPVVPATLFSRSEQIHSSENVSPPQLIPIVSQNVVVVKRMLPPPRGPPTPLLPTTLGVNHPSSQFAHPHSRLYRIPSAPVAQTPPSLATPHAQNGRAKLPIYAPVPTPTLALPLADDAPIERVPALYQPQPALTQNALPLHRGPHFPMHAIPYVCATPLRTFPSSRPPVFADPLHQNQYFSHNTGPFPVQDCANDPLGPRFPQHAPFTHGNCTVSSLPYPQISQGSHPGGDASFDTHPQPFPTFIPPLPLTLPNAPVLPRLPPPPAVKPPWSTLFESVKLAAGKPRKVARRKVDPAEYIEDQVMGSLSTATHSRDHPTRGVAGAGDMHRCPLCLRAFSLPHSLAIHLKWHWGASSLDWKRGISKRCKAIERAFLDAERRREESAQQQLENDLPRRPSSLTMLDMHAGQVGGDDYNTLPLATALDPTSLSDNLSRSFAMPIVARQSFDAFDFSLSSSESPLSANSTCVSPTGSHHSHVFPPAILAPSSTATMMYDSLPHTPDLLIDTGSSNGASTGRASPTWSDHLFGPEEHAGAETRGENEGDLFGACLPVAAGIHRFGAAATTGSTSTDASADPGPSVRAHIRPSHKFQL
ncbi:hypothetical protein C8Q70DRAFT_525883 [Cubamyces menziesii]|nr:hypothetical protein C8Q70DRAFT_525883 [Cubamyces menziesii]